ncbi:MAG TPA: GAF domain-containing protein [Terriglobales bacterium]|nr:GAF domain-containing protein [Terriglobales bacterium]
MSNHQELLKEFETHNNTAGGLKGLMQHVSERLHEQMARYNWVGFYFLEAPAFDTLMLGPYVGSFAPNVRIPIDKGLCGAAARSQQTVCVNNVANDSRYIGGDMVKSNIIVPIFAKKKMVAELCVESYFVGTFDAPEQKFIESCAALVGRYMEKDSPAGAMRATAAD